MRPMRIVRSWVGMLALVLIFLAVNLQLLTGAAIEHDDGADFFAPFFAYLASVVRSGEWLLWNPFSNAGSPDFAEPQIGALSPLTLAFAALAGPSAVAFRCYWLCVWLLGGVGMFVYARSLGAPVWGRFLAGLGFVLSGYYFGHAQHTSVVHSISFLPWIVLRLDRALLTGRRAPAIEAGALWGLSALAGNPAVTMSTGLFAAGVALVRVLEGSGAARVRVALLSMALFGGVGTAVLAPTYFSFKHEGLGFSTRAGPLTRACVVESNRMTPAGLVALVSPYAPTVHCENARGLELISVTCPTYFGAAPLALALLALALPGRRRWRWGIFALSLLFIGLALGSSLPLRGWLYDLVPPTRYFRHPNMFRGFVIFALLALAAVATARLERWRIEGGAPAGMLRAFAILSTLLGVVGIGGLALFYRHSEKLGPYPQAAMAHALFVWIGLAGLAWFCVARPAWATRLPAAIVALTVVDLVGAHFLSGDFAFRIGEGDEPRPTSARSPVDLGPGNFSRGLIVSGNRHLYMHKPVYSSYAAMLNTMHMDSAEAGTLMEFATGQDRVWFSPSAIEAPVNEATMEALTRDAIARKAPVLVRHRRATLLGESSGPALDVKAIRAAPGAVRVPFEVGTYRANELSLRATCPQEGWLLITDRWSRSWRATVNGVPTDISGGNFFFRLLPVQAGENHIAMRFEPFLLWPLLATSWGVLAAVAIAAALRARDRSARRPSRAVSFHPDAPVPCAVS